MGSPGNARNHRLWTRHCPYRRELGACCGPCPPLNEEVQVTNALGLRFELHTVH